MLSARNLSLSFRGVRALAGVNVAIAEGELLGIMGPNGSGKSTLFNVLSGIYRADAGDILFRGKSLIGLKPAEVVRRGMARTFQNKRLFSTMTVFENVVVAALKGAGGSALGDVLGLAAAAGGMRQARSTAESCLDLVGLGSLTPALARDLPYGAQNRLEIARALALSPKLLLLDEPAAGLNPAERESLQTLIRRIHGRGVTIALVEHDVRMVTGLSSRILVLDHGEVIANGPAQTVVRDPRVLTAYFGPDEDDDAG